MKKIYKISLSLIILVGIIAISLPSLLTLAGLHPKFNGDTFNLDGKRALIIATNHGVLNKPGETSGKPTGLFLSELSIPYYDFKKSNIQVEIASIKGGNIPLEPLPYFIETEEDKNFFLNIVKHAEFEEIKDAAHMVAGDKNNAFQATIYSFLHKHN